MRRIKLNHRTAVPSNHAAFDCETIPKRLCPESKRDVQVLRLGCAMGWRYEEGEASREDTCEFTRSEDFWAWVTTRLSKTHPLWLWAHNAGFDTMAVHFWTMIESGEFRLWDWPDQVASPAPKPNDGRKWVGLCVTEDPPTIICARHKSGAIIRIVDTLNWFLCPLEEVGAALGLPQEHKPEFSDPDTEWWKRCRRDVEIVRGAVDQLTSFVFLNDLGNFKPTAASQAMAAYRHRCMLSPIDTTDKPHVKAMERKCYYGGRQWLYYRGSACRLDKDLPVDLGKEWMADAHVWTHGIHHVDLTAAYPSAMKGRLYPCRYNRTEVGLSPRDALNWLGAFAGCGEVTVATRERPYPLRQGEETVWCVGSFRTNLAGPELIAGLMDGTVTDVHSLQLYSQAPLFDTFVDLFWHLRQHYKEMGNKVMERLCKLLSNSLHGKFGQRNHPWELRAGLIAPIPWGAYLSVDRDSGKLTEYRSLGWHAQEKCEPGEAEGNFPLISAYTTSYLRLFMRALVEEAGPRNVYLEDCDSLHISSAGLERLRAAGEVEDGVMGKLHLVKSADWAVWRGPKDYNFGGKIVRSGQSRNAVQVSPGVWAQTQFHRRDTMLRGQPAPGPLTEEITKVAPELWQRGAVGVDGWTSPLIEGLFGC